MIKEKFPWVEEVTSQWLKMLKILQHLKPKLYYCKVYWEPPPKGWMVCNTDGVSKDNPRRSTYAFCTRDYGGNLVYAEA